MKSKISLFNPTVYWKNIKRFWPVWTVYTIYLVLRCPWRLYYRVTTANMSELMDPVQAKMAWMSQMLNGIDADILILICMGLICAAAVWSYLYRQKSSTFVHSLPLRRHTLFLTNILSGLSMIVIPTVFAYGCGMLVAAAYHYPNIAQMAKAMGILICVGILFFGMASFVAMITGNLLVLPALYGVFQFVLAYLYAILEAAKELLLFGSGGGWDMKDWLSPVLVVLHRTGITFTYKESGDIQAFHIYGARTALICAAAGIVMLAAAWLLYRKHHTERCGDTITVQWLRPVIKYGFIVCFAPLMAAILGSFGLYEAIGTVTGSSLPTILILLWISGICGYFIAEMLLQKTFRVFGKTHVLYCLIFNVVLTVPVLALGLDVFGYSKWVPETGEIERVILNRSTGSVSDPDAVEQIVAVHQGIADDRTMFRKRMMTVHVPDPEEWNYRYIDLTYQLKNGKVRSRHFVLRFQDDEMDSSLYRQIREMMGQPKVVYARYFPDHFEIARTEDVYVNHYLPESDGDDLPESDGDDQEVSDTVTTHFRVTREDRKKQIYDAVCADIESGALKIMDEYYSDKEAVYNVQIPYYFGGEQEPTRYTAVSIDVGEDSRETIKILNKLEKLYNR